MIFKKKTPPDIEKPEIEIEETKEEEAKVPIEVTVERLKAQVEALSEFRKIVLERMNTMSEQLGELRSIIISKEREIREIEAKATKAFDMVSEVQPEKLRIDLQKEATKREALMGEIKTLQERATAMENQLREIRAKLQTIRGVEEIVKMNEEIKKELMEMKRMESRIGAHADKVEDIYLNVEKRFTDFERYKEMVSGLESRIEEMEKDLKDVKARLPKFIDRDDFNKLRNEIRSKLLDAEKLLESMKEIQEFLKRVDIQKRLYELEEEMIRTKRNLTSTGEYLEDVTSVIENLKKEIEQLKEHTNENEVRIMRMLEVLEVLAKKVVGK